MVSKTALRTGFSLWMGWVRYVAEDHQDDEDALDVVEQGDSFAPAFFHAQPLSLRTKLSC